MRFEMLALTWLVYLALIGCGDVRPAVDPNFHSAGDQPTFYASASNSSAVGEDRIVVADTKAGRLNRFSLNPMALERSTPLPFETSQQSVLPADDGSYDLIISGSDYAIVSDKGVATKNPVELAGRITGVAYDGASHHLALFDDVGSIAALVLAPGGAVLKSHVFGPVVTDADHLMTAATMAADGRLVLVLKGIELAVVDIDASIDAGAWRLNRFTVEGATAIDWVAGIKATPNLIFARDTGRLLSLSLADGAIVDQRPLDGLKLAGAYRGARPTVVAASGAKVTMFYADDAGSIQSRDVIVQAGTSVTSTSIDLARGIVTIIARDNKMTSTLRRYRTSDSLVMTQVEIPATAAAIVTPSWIVMSYEAELGLLERRDYSRDPHVVRLEGYNLAAFLERARQ